MCSIDRQSSLVQYDWSERNCGFGTTMTRWTRRTALASIGAGLVAIVVDTAGFERTAANRGASIGVADDSVALVGIDGSDEATSQVNPHAVCFTNRIDESLSITAHAKSSDLRFDESETEVEFDLDPGQERPMAVYSPDDRTIDPGTIAVSATTNSGLDLELDRDLRIVSEGIRSWHTADDESTISSTNGDGTLEVEEWRDKMGSLDCAPPGDDDRPQYRSSAPEFDDRPAIAFDGAPGQVLGHGFTNVTGESNVAVTVFVVLRSDDGTDSRPLSLYNPVTEEPSEIAIVDDDPATGEARVEVTLDGETVILDDVDIGTDPALVAVRTRLDERDGDDDRVAVTARVHENGTFQRHTTTALPAESFPDLALGIGGRYDPESETTDTEYEGLVASIALYDSALDSVAMESIERSLGRTWPVDVDDQFEEGSGH